MTTLMVGATQQYHTIAAAVAASHDGDVLKVQAGTYTNDFAEITTKITIEGVGGMVKMVATAPIPNGKAILITDTDVTLDHIEFSGAKVRDGNGAGVRYQAGNLTITNSYFHDNQNGILAAAGSGNITIKNSEFSHNGAGDGRTHNIYIGDIASLTIDQSYFHDAVVGHEIKSRAEVTTITNSRITDGASGSASYSIDLPNGGNAVIRNNVIQQGPASQNPAIIAFGEEGDVHAGSSLVVSGNTVLNDLRSPSASAVWNATTVSASVTGNSFYGLSAGQILKGAGAVSGSVMLGADRALDTSSPILPATPVVTPPVVTPPVVVPPVVVPPVATPPVVIPPVATPPVVVPPVATPPVVIPPVATPPVVVPPVATPPVVIPPVATPPVVTPPVATSPDVTINASTTMTISNATINAVPGSFTVGLNGTGNTVSMLSGWEEVWALDGANAITTGSGRDTIHIGGRGNLVDAGGGGGGNIIYDNGDHNTVVLHAGGQGYDDLIGAILTNGDVLDVRAALGTTTWNGDAATVGNYLTTASVNGGQNTQLLLSATAGGAGVAIANLHKTGIVSTADVLQHVRVS